MALVSILIRHSSQDYLNRKIVSPLILIHKILCHPTIQVVSSALVSTSSTALDRPFVVDPLIDTIIIY
jgi:hypothetical protein